MHKKFEKNWLKTEIFKPDDDLKLLTMKQLYQLYIDFSSFIESLYDEEWSVTFDEVFMSTDYVDYLKLVKIELKTILLKVDSNEQLTGIFIGLLGHEMSFNQSVNLLTLEKTKKELIMLHSLKLLDISYYELYQEPIPLPDEYREWLDESEFKWELGIKDLLE